MYRPTSIRTSSCFFPGFPPTAFLVAACLHTCFWPAFPLALARKANFKSPDSPDVPQQHYSHAKSASSHSLSSFVFWRHVKRPDVRPYIPVRTSLRSACLHPANVALFMRCHRRNLPATLRLCQGLWRILLMAQHMFSWERRRLVVLLSDLWSAVELCLADGICTFSSHLLLWDGSGFKPHQCIYCAEDSYRCALW